MTGVCSGAESAPRVTAERVAAAPACALAESPRLSPCGELLWFIDIEAARVWRVRVELLHDATAYACAPLPQLPGFVIPESADRVLVGLADGLYRLDWPSGELELVWALPEAPVPVRVNDGAAAPDGAIWFGTMNLESGDPDAGWLYRYADGAGRVIDGPVACWNGIVFDVGGARVLATDTLGRELREYAPGARAAVGGSAAWELVGSVAVPGADRPGLPDGLTAGPGGTLWSALWDAGEVLVLRDWVAAGAVRVPGSRPTATAVLPDGGVVITLAADSAGPGGLALLAAEAAARLCGR